MRNLGFLGFRVYGFGCRDLGFQGSTLASRSGGEFSGFT